jgi:SNF2 family DNA or RNA helicase
MSAGFSWGRPGGFGQGKGGKGRTRQEQVSVTFIVYSLHPSNKRFGLKSKYDAALVSIYKSLPGGLWDAKLGCWHYPWASLEMIAAELDKVLGRDGSYKICPFPTFLKDLMDSEYMGRALGTANEDAIAKEISGRMLNIPDHLREGLFPHQKDAVHFAIRRQGRVLIGDEPGCGKTIEGIAIACAYAEDWPLLIMCPGIIKKNWEKELRQWVPWLGKGDVQIVRTGSSPLDSDAKVFITTYDLIPKLVQVGTVTAGQFKVVIAGESQRCSCTRCDPPADHHCIFPYACCKDESHNLKSPDAQRTKAAIPLIEQASRAVLMTGTPVLAKPVEIFTTLRSLLPKCIFPTSWDPFTERYCAATVSQFGKNVSGSSNTSELKILLEKTVMLRRLKRDVLMELPSKSRETIIVPVDADMRPEIDNLMAQKLAVEDSLKNSGTLSFQAIQSLKNEAQKLTSQLYSATGTGKVRGVISVLQDYIRRGKFGGGPRKLQLEASEDDLQEDLSSEGDVWACASCTFINQVNCNECKCCGTIKDGKMSLKRKRSPAAAAASQSSERLKFVIFAHHKNVMDAIQEAMTKKAGLRVVRIDGQTPMSQRQTLVDKFQNEDVEIFLLSISAAGVGITLTAASTAVFAELSWTPGQLVQAEDRIHRIGQDASEVKILYLLAEKSLDQQMMESLTRKQHTLMLTTGLAKDDQGFHNVSHKPLASGQRSISDMFKSSKSREGTALASVHPSAPAPSASPAQLYPPLIASSWSRVTSSTLEVTPSRHQAEARNFQSAAPVTNLLSPETQKRIEEKRRQALEKLEAKKKKAAGLCARAPIVYDLTDD